MKSPRKYLAITILAALIIAIIFLWLGKARVSPAGSETTKAEASAPATPDSPAQAPLPTPATGTSDAADPTGVTPVATSIRRGPNNRLIYETATDLERVTRDGRLSGETILRVRDGEPVGPLTLDEHTLSAVEATFDPAALQAFLNSDARLLRLPLASGQNVVVAVDKIIQRGDHTRTLVGKVQDDPFSDVLLVFHDGAVSGSIAFLNTNTHYQYGMAGNGDVAIRKLDTETYQAPCGDPGETPAGDEAMDPTADPGVAQGVVSGEPPAGSLIMDTVVGYGAQARAAVGGVAAIEALIIASVDRMNTAFVNSQAGTSFTSLMATIEDPDYVFPGDVSGDMGSADELGHLNTHGDGILDTISQLRIDLGADQNTLVVKNADGSAGIAYRPGKSMIVARDYMTSTRITFSHEFGHNIGCRHSWGDDTPSPVNVDNYGWRLDPPSSVAVRTIMAYDWGWGNGTRIPYFSNPDVFYNGARTGAVNGYDATGDATADQRYVSGGLNGTEGAGFDGTNPGLGARNAIYIAANASTVNDNAIRKNLAVLDPAASVTWLQGVSQTIYWLGGDHTDTAVIALYKGGVFQSTIASGVSGEDRWHSWIPPNGLAAGADYKIRVTLNGSNFDDSSAFTIGIPPDVQINSPTAILAGISTTSQRLLLDATVTPGSGGGSVVSTWSKINGPGTATFENPASADTTVTFSATGLYQLRLTATQSGLTGSADIRIHVGNAASTTSLAVKYAFDQSSGTTSADSSGKSNNASITGTAAWTSGQRGNAVLLSQSPTYIDSNAGVAINNPSGISAAAWVRLDAAATNNRHIIRQNTGGGSGRSWLYVDSKGFLKSSLGNTTTTGTAMPLNEWHHVALTGGGGTISIYLDGKLAGSKAGTVETCSGIIRLGQNSSTTDSALQWIGAIDEARVYQRVLTAQEIAALMATNTAPDVNAGPDAAALAGIPTNLAGITSDDASLPTQLWSQLSGPAAASITNSQDSTSDITFPAAGTYVLRLTANDGEIQTCDDVTWNVTTPSPDEQWRFTNFGITGNSGDAADDFDYDGDGFVNLLERALGTDPKDASSHAPPSMAAVDIAGNPGGDYLSISYRRLSGGVSIGDNSYTSQGITYRVEHSTSLVESWDDTGFTLLTVTPPVDGVETATLRLNATISGDAATFLHLKVSSP